MTKFDIQVFHKDPFKNIYVEASAGTGKTFTIKNIVASLVSHGVSLRQMLVVTYTEKAAGELKDRIRKELKEVCVSKRLFGSEPIDNVVLANFEAQLKCVDEAAIGTIHSFCQTTLDQLAFRAGVPNSLSLIDEASALKAFVHKWVADRMHNDPDYIKLPCKVDRVEDKLFRAIYRYYLDKNGNEVSSIVSLEGSTDVEFSFLEKKTRELYVEWQKLKLGRKMQSFDDMIRNVREAVCDPEDHALRDFLRSRYRVAIIDEFQDTNQRQWDIFRSVFMGTDANNIIVVGDPKQSIYRFQGADLNVFLKAVQEIGTGFCLDTNYRSSDQMIGACNAFFENDGSQNGGRLNNFVGSLAGGKISRATFGEGDVPPFWILGAQTADNGEMAGTDSKSFANMAVRKMVECMQKDDMGRTRLQVCKEVDGKKQLCNVTWGDFAVLVRTRSELPDIEAALAYVGIPFARYKDNRLFESKVCKDWIVLLDAIAAPDFSGHNRSLLSKALLSNFFAVPAEEILSPAYDTRFANFFTLWRNLAQNRMWPKLIESILHYTKIEARLQDSMADLAKVRQIANYIVEFLVARNASLSQVIKDLLSHGGNADEGNFVAIASDSHRVQLMTIHSSKGLEFPVVVLPAGIQGQGGKELVALFDEGNGPVVSFDTNAHANDVANANEDELHRLFYVALTRASAVVMMPIYSKPGSGVEFFNKLKKDFVGDNRNNNLWCPLEVDVPASLDDAMPMVEQMLSASNCSLSQDDFDEQNALIVQKAKSVRSARCQQNSYSSLTHGHVGSSTPLEVTSDPSRRANSEGDDFSGCCHSIDPQAVHFAYNHENQRADRIAVPSYPRGAKLGSAIHRVLELSDFAAVGRKHSFANLRKDPDMRSLVAQSFLENGLSVDAQNDENQWIVKTLDFVWHSLNATLPVIRGGVISPNESFALTSLNPSQCKAEAEFNMKVFVDDVRLQNLLTGFIDLLFVREVDGNKVFSVLDWKSDSLDDYSDHQALRSRVDECYSIQRVLYSYCLIKWLKSLGKYRSMTESDIFDNHFGGIYYVFVRGTQSGKSIGTCSLTWKSWDVLSQAYDTICQRLKSNTESDFETTSASDEVQ